MLLVPSFMCLFKIKNVERMLQNCFDEMKIVLQMALVLKLQILRLWSGIVIRWFRNPLPFFLKHKWIAQLKDNNSMFWLEMFYFVSQDVLYESYFYSDVGTMVKRMYLSYRASVGSNTWPQVSTFLCDWSGDGWSFHFTLDVDDYSRIVLEVNEDSISSAERFTLSNDNGGHDLKNEKMILDSLLCTRRLTFNSPFFSTLVYPSWLWRRTYHQHRQLADDSNDRECHEQR